MRLLAVALAVLALTPLGLSLGADEARWSLVEYRAPVAPADRAFLFATADQVADAAPPFGYVAKLTAADRAALLARPEVAAIRPYPESAKLSPDLAPGEARLRILLFPDEDARAFVLWLARAGASSALVAATSEPLLDVELGTLDLGDIAARPEVRWVEPRADEATLDNARASSIVQSGKDAEWSVHAQGVDGSSQIVAYCDTGLDTDAPLALGAGSARHEMFADPLAPLVHNAPAPHHRKVALYYSPIDAGGVRGDMDDAEGHGTHVAGTLAGDAGAPGSRDGDDGVAFAARLAVCDATRGIAFQVLADPAPYWQPAYDIGARVHSNSWGTTPSTTYTLAARQHDAYAWAHRDFLILRSMGNGGPDGAMRQEAAAKSVLAIGATTNEASGARVADFSGRGPAADGRIKPDLVAPGSCVRSADIASPTAYACWSGTSFATPVAAGAATLVRDYFAKGYHPSGAPVAADARNVSSALVRAILVASATRVAASSPDGAEGWGRPELDRALAFAGGNASLLVHDEETAVDTGDAWTTTVGVEAGAALRVVLAWTDPPAAPGAAVALVNDLDLELVAPDGTIHQGNADLASPDRRNVVERVFLDDAPPGTYTIRVRAWNAAMGPQTFAVVAVAQW